MTEAERQTLFATARDAILTELPEVWTVYVYGSFARGDEWPTSDLDIGVLLPPGLRIRDKLKSMQKVAAVAGRDIDLVDLRQAGLDLVREILRQGRVVFSRHPSETLVWEAEKMTDYAEFNPRRAGILDTYLRQPLRTRT